jgi:PilZ domain
LNTFAHYVRSDGFVEGESRMKPSDQRKHPRRELGLAARVTWPVTVPCTISDVSATGARLTTKYPRSLPNEFHLALNADLMRKCRVVWRSGNQIGVSFLANIDAGTK